RGAGHDGDLVLVGADCSREPSAQPVHLCHPQLPGRALAVPRFEVRSDRLLDVHRKRALRATVHVDAVRENRKALAKLGGCHATTSRRAEPRVLRYAADMIKRNGTNSGMLYRRPSTKNVVNAIARSATIPNPAANRSVGSVSGSRSRIVRGTVRRNCR